MPWGNLGTSLNGVCAAALYNHYAFDGFKTPNMVQSRCFMQRQLGYIFNHKCAASAKSRTSSCNTRSAEGFSYMVGYDSACFPLSVLRGSFMDRLNNDLAIKPQYFAPLVAKILLLRVVFGLAKSG
jgi:hypothetical protein